MPSTKSPSSIPASIATAAQKTKSVIEDLQNKLSEVSQPGGARPCLPQEAEQEVASEHSEATPERSDIAETEAELERQLEAYFARVSAAREGGSTAPIVRSKTLEELRRRVVDGVVERILHDWVSDSPGARVVLRDEVMEQLIERVFHQFEASNAVESDARPA